MDPVSVITGALIAGAASATKNVTSQAIQDAYGALKQRILRRFGKDADLADAVARLEANPERKSRQEGVREEVEISGAAGDRDIVASAQALLDLLKQQGALSREQYSAIVSGSGAVAQGPGAVAAGEGGFAVGGSVHGNVQHGDRRVDTGGGSYVEGDVEAGDDFVGRDKSTPGGK